MTVNVQPYLSEAAIRRQKFEMSHRFAIARQRPVDFENAMADAVAYINAFDGLIAAIQRDTLK